MTKIFIPIILKGSVTLDTPDLDSGSTQMWFPLSDYMDNHSVGFDRFMFHCMGYDAKY